MIESTLLSLVEKYLTVENSITYDPLTLKTTMYFRKKIAYEHSLDLTELEEHLLEKVNARLENDNK
jgi:hypothetical protein